MKEISDSDRSAFWPTIAAMLLALVWLCQSARGQEEWTESHRLRLHPGGRGQGSLGEASYAPRETAANTWQAAYQAVARVNAGDSWGSGTCFWRDARSVYVLTNAHVVGRHTDVACEFVQQGRRSRQIAGRVVARAYDQTVDAAIIALPVASFGGRLPHVLAIGPDPRPGQAIVTIGCPRADHPALWYGHVVESAGGGTRVVFTPGSWPIGSGDMMSGRSGSSLLDESGTRIIGLVAWSDGQERGMAMPISLLLRQTGFHAHDETCPHGHPIQWGGQGGGSCPLCPGGSGGGGGGENPWPGLPAPGGGGNDLVDDRDLRDIERRLRSLEEYSRELAPEWAELRAAYREAKEKWPQIEAAIDASGNATLRAAAEQIKELDRRLVEAVKEAEDATAAAVEEATEDAQEEQEEEVKSLKEKLAEHAREVLTLKNALKLGQAVDEQGVSGVLGAAKDAAPSLILELIKGVSWPLAGVLSVFFWAARARQRVRRFRKSDGTIEEMEAV